MQRKITDVFSNLLRQWGEDDEEERQAVLQSQLEQVQQEEQVRQDYKNLKWSRIISVDEYESHSTMAYDMDADIIAALELIKDIDSKQFVVIPAQFDPMALQ